MGVCSAYDCSNDFKSGHRTFQFPLDPKRRQAWVAEVNRPNWSPTKNSRLCEVHFTQDQYFFNTSRQLLVLRPDAIPTKFCTPKGNSPTKKGEGQSKTEAAIQHDHYYASDLAASKDNGKGSEQDTDSVDLEESQEDLNSECEDLFSMHSEMKSDPNLWPMPQEEAFDIDFMTKDLDQHDALQQARTLEKKLTLMKDKLRKTQRKYRRVCRERNALAAKHFESDGQSQYRKMTTEWTTEKLKRAQQIRSACGDNGYKKLLEFKYPLPSIRTLQRRANKLDTSEVQETTS
eukprot:maker-scaffold40_size501252-snap-gene-0.12 protein:Tk06151 transcript:maker-scaffold40_size501252-snap-gene-0.12-mRNA-1 annotation:"PREDICTED: uncharacterized protein LOC101167150"